MKEDGEVEGDSSGGEEQVEEEELERGGDACTLSGGEGQKEETEGKGEREEEGGENSVGMRVEKDSEGLGRSVEEKEGADVMEVEEEEGGGGGGKEEGEEREMEEEERVEAASRLQGRLVGRKVQKEEDGVAGVGRGAVEWGKQQ